MAARVPLGTSNMTREAEILWNHTPADKRRNIVRIVQQVAAEMGLTFTTQPTPNPVVSRD